MNDRDESSGICSFLTGKYRILISAGLEDADIIAKLGELSYW
jgi:hypothetical protein